MENTITERELWQYYKNTCHARKVSFEEFKKNHFVAEEACEDPKGRVAFKNESSQLGAGSDLQGNNMRG
jgi:hypothetical protein